MTSGAMMKPQKRIKKKTRQALITWTVDLVCDIVAKMKSISVMRTLKKNRIAMKIKKFSAVLVKPTIKYRMVPKAMQSIKICQ